jgi:serine/threonine-protein kinase
MDLFDRLKSALAGRYALERKLGAGGMAVVYLAHDVRHNRKVAIKVMHPDLAAVVGADRFLREIQTTANLQHPHILPLFDSGLVEGTVFYVMPYLEGESLRARLAREVQLPVADALRITAEVAAGLDYAHRHGVIHRDIKPDNVLFQDGRAVLADFGIALAQSTDGTRIRMTEAGVSVGSPSYMSPEQAAGQQNLDPRTDIYSLGVMLYEMLAGQRPFTGRTPQAIFSKVMSEDSPPVVRHRKAVPPHVDAAISRALEKLPADRWQTVAEFSAALTGGGGAAWWRDSRRSAARWRTAVPWALAGAFLLAFTWVGLRSRREAPAPSSPMRFDVELDPGVQLSFTPIVRLSADGRQLFVTAMVNRREEVVHRHFDRFGTDVIQGAGQGDQGTGNSRPFVSPDGRWVAYARQQKLWKVPVEGGPAIELATADWAGGSWGKNGKLVYTRAYNTRLWIVSEENKNAQMISAPDSTTGKLGHW